MLVGQNRLCDCPALDTEGGWNSTRWVVEDRVGDPGDRSWEEKCLSHVPEDDSSAKVLTGAN